MNDAKENKKDEKLEGSAFSVQVVDSRPLFRAEFVKSYE
jgi:hypothetical protein